MNAAELGNTIFSAIRNPGTFYFRNVHNDWTAPQNDALWRDEDKTLFDPCPAGWRVPKNGPDNLSPWALLTLENSTWNGEATNPSGGRVYDRSVVYGPNGAWYPANGVRYAHTSYLNECASIGYAWSVTCTAELTYRLLLQASFVEPARTAYGWRAHSFSVRCIRE